MFLFISDVSDVLQNRCSEKFRQITGKQLHRSFFSVKLQAFKYRFANIAFYLL